MTTKVRDATCLSLEELDGEIWLPVANFDGYFADCYSVSNLGRIKGHKRRVKCRGKGATLQIRERIRKLGTLTGGYLQLRLRKNGGRKMMLVNRAVCETFNGPPKPGEECHHINNCRTDNRADNLVFVSKKVHALLTAGQKLTRKDVWEIRKLRNEGHLQKEIAKRFDVSREAIRDICTGYRWKPRMVDLFDYMEAERIKELAWSQS